MGEVIVTVDSAQGVTRVQLKATSRAEERQSIQLYQRLKPIIETINVHVPTPLVRKTGK